MASRVLWLLDNETDDHTFERLCTSLMYRWGYRKIVPIGRTADRGRDAEAEVALGEGREAEKVFFQYTLERRWEPKITKELRKVRQNNHLIDKYVFITRGSITGASRDKYTRSVLADYGWKLELFDREWLRHQLEEANPSLVSLYLHEAIPPSDVVTWPLEVLPQPENPTVRSIWQSLVLGNYEASIPALRGILEDESSIVPKDEVWAALAWCYYSLFNYKEAHHCIATALAINSTSSRHRAIKGCVLCEQGAETGSLSLFVAAKAIFQELVAGATDYGAYYNLGNALSGLGEYDRARDAYLEAINFNDKVAEIWKNLGTCYFHLGDHQRELECYDTALSLNPQLSHALVSKANTTAAVFHNYSEALRLLDQAAQADSDIGKHWPHFHWWKAHYLFHCGELRDALCAADGGLASHPEQTRLLDLKARILGALWRKEPSARSDAKTFFLFRLEAVPAEIPSLIELAELSASESCTRDVWAYLVRAFNAAARSSQLTPSDLEGLTESKHALALAHHLQGYCKYRKARPLQLVQDPSVRKDSCGLRYLWVVFGLAYTDLLQKTPSKDSSVGEIVSFYRDIRGAVKHAIQAIAARLANEHQSADTATKIAIMSSSLVALAEAALYESTWLGGYLTAANGVAEEVFAEANEQFIQENDQSPFRTEVIDAVLRPLNDAWGLFPEKNAIRP